MPQRRKLANRKPLDPPRVADALERQLFGLGSFTLHLDGYRLKAPTSLCKRLDAYCDQPFIFSIWHGSRLRIIPQILWTTYLQSVRAGINHPAAADDLVLRLRHSSVVRSLDKHRRWDLPASLAKHAGFAGAENFLILFPYRFWLELLSADAWESFLTQTQQCAHEADSCQSDYAI